MQWLLKMHLMEVSRCRKKIDEKVFESEMNRKRSVLNELEENTLSNTYDRERLKGDTALIEKYDELYGGRSSSNPYLDENQKNYRGYSNFVIFLCVIGLIGFVMERITVSINSFVGTSFESFELFFILSIIFIILYIFVSSVNRYCENKSEAILHGFSSYGDFKKHERIVLYYFDRSTLSELGNKVLDNISVKNRSGEIVELSLYKLNEEFNDVAKKNGFSEKIKLSYENRNNKKIIFLSILNSIKNSILRRFKYYLFVIPSYIIIYLSVPVCVYYIIKEYFHDYGPVILSILSLFVWWRLAKLWLSFFKKGRKFF